MEYLEICITYIRYTYLSRYYFLIRRKNLDCSVANVVFYTCILFNRFDYFFLVYRIKLELGALLIIYLMHFNETRKYLYTLNFVCFSYLTKIATWFCYTNTNVRFTFHSVSDKILTRPLIVFLGITEFKRMPSLPSQRFNCFNIQIARVWMGNPFLFFIWYTCLLVVPSFTFSINKIMYFTFR